MKSFFNVISLRILWRRDFTHFEDKKKERGFLFAM
jgi:hypothetical protein